MINHMNQSQKYNTAWRNKVHQGTHSVSVRSASRQNPAVAVKAYLDALTRTVRGKGVIVTSITVTIIFPRGWGSVCGNGCWQCVCFLSFHTGVRFIILKTAHTCCTCPLVWRMHLTMRRQGVKAWMVCLIIIHDNGLSAVCQKLLETSIWRRLWLGNPNSLLWAWDWWLSMPPLPLPHPKEPAAS